jgi:hypothetical protein
MYQKDYLLRMIEMFGDLLRAIFGMISQKEFRQASRELNEAYLTMLRKDASFFQRIPIHELTTTLISDHHYTHAHLEVLAGLFYAEATLQYAKNRLTDSLSFYQKSLLLFEFVDKEYRTYSDERLQTMEQIRKRILEIEERAV